MGFTSGTVLADRWQILDRVASGGMGDVYRARDQRLDRTVAIKLLRPHDTSAEQRFATEVATHARLQHPNIVTLFDADEHDGAPFLVMEFVDGPSLASLIARGPLPLEEVRDTGRCIASALAYAHERGVIHRDVKPGNILFDAVGAAHLADFGIVQLADAAGVTATGVTIGSAGYVAPEQLTDAGKVGPATDVYALGLVLLEAATGERAFNGPETEAAFQRLTRDPEIPYHLPEDLAHLLREMTRRDPATRPTAADAASRLSATPAGDRARTMVLPERTVEPDAETVAIGSAAASSAASTNDVADGTVGIDGSGGDPADGGESRTSPVGTIRRARWSPLVVAVAIGLAAFTLFARGVGSDDGQTTGGEAGDESVSQTQLDPALADAFDRLEEAVRP